MFQFEFFCTAKRNKDAASFFFIPISLFFFTRGAAACLKSVLLPCLSLSGFSFILIRIILCETAVRRSSRRRHTSVTLVKVFPTGRVQVQTLGDVGHLPVDLVRENCCSTHVGFPYCIYGEFVFPRTSRSLPWIRAPRQSRRTRRSWTSVVLTKV